MFKGLRERLSGIGEPPPGPDTFSSSSLGFDAQACNRFSDVVIIRLLGAYLIRAPKDTQANT